MLLRPACEVRLLVSKLMESRITHHLGSLDWTYEAENELQVDEYEHCRPKRRSQPCLSLSASERWMLLLDKHSPIELDRIVQEITRLQRVSTQTDDSPEEWMQNCNVDKKPSRQPKLKNFFSIIVKGKSTFNKLRRRRTSSEGSTASTASMEDDELLEDSLDDRDSSSQVDDDESFEREDIREEDEQFAFVQLEL